MTVNKQLLLASAKMKNSRLQRNLQELLIVIAKFRQIQLVRRSFRLSKKQQLPSKNKNVCMKTTIACLVAISIIDFGQLPSGAMM